MAIRRNFDHLATTPRPALTCVGCGQPLDADWQPGLSACDGYWLVTCTQSVLVCELGGYTLAAEPYPPDDLDAYREGGTRRRAALLAKESV